VAEGVLPRLRVQIDGIDERPVDVKDDGFNHRRFPLGSMSAA
jgi:hypothetical protein